MDATCWDDEVTIPGTAITSDWKRLSKQISTCDCVCDLLLDLSQNGLKIIECDLISVLLVK